MVDSLPSAPQRTPPPLRQRKCVFPHYISRLETWWTAQEHGTCWSLTSCPGCLAQFVDARRVRKASSCQCQQLKSCWQQHEGDPLDVIQSCTLLLVCVASATPQLTGEYSQKSRGNSCGRLAIAVPLSSFNRAPCFLRLLRRPLTWRVANFRSLSILEGAGLNIETNYCSTYCTVRVYYCST